MIKEAFRAAGRRGFRTLCAFVIGTVFILSFLDNERTSLGNSISDGTTATVPTSSPHGTRSRLEDQINSEDWLNAEEETSASPAAPPGGKSWVAPSTTGLKPTGSDFSGLPRAEEVKEYLWKVYERSATKTDSRGDFTWKDASAAANLGLSIEGYVIGGMDSDFREQLFAAGQAMDAAGIDWTILSAFRDDYRQSLAVGFKAHYGNSFHGGSAATGGYGHGCAVDLASTDGLSNETVWNWLDQHGRQFGLFRPLRRIDPAHVQPITGWHELADTLRKERVRAHPEPVSGTNSNELVSPLSASSADFSSGAGVTDEQYNCVRPRPVGEPNQNQREEIARHLNSPVPHYHLSSLVIHTPPSSADRNLKAKWRTIGAVAIHHASLRHSPLDTYSRHSNGREGSALRTRTSTPALHGHNRAASTAHSHTLSPAA